MRIRLRSAACAALLIGVGVALCVVSEPATARSTDALSPAFDAGLTDSVTTFDAKLTTQGVVPPPEPSSGDGVLLVDGTLDTGDCTACNSMWCCEVTVASVNPDCCEVTVASVNPNCCEQTVQSVGQDCCQEPTVEVDPGCVAYSQFTTPCYPCTVEYTTPCVPCTYEPGCPPTAEMVLTCLIKPCPGAMASPKRDPRPSPVAETRRGLWAAALAALGLA